MSDRLQTIVVVTVVAVWGSLTVASFLFPDHDVPTTVDTIMGIIAGGAVANEVVKRAQKRSDNGGGKNGKAKSAPPTPPDDEPLVPGPRKPPAKAQPSIQDEAIRRGQRERKGGV